MIDKNDGALYNFMRAFCDSLAVEYGFVEQIAANLANQRPEAVQRQLGLMFKAVNLVVSNASPFGSALVSTLTNLVESKMQDKNNQKTENRFAALSKHAPDKRAFLFEQIANEVTYRYGPAIINFTNHADQNDSSMSSTITDRLARTGAIRIVYFALKTGTGFEECEKLVKGAT
jgi:hypothetical protein